MTFTTIRNCRPSLLPWLGCCCCRVQLSRELASGVAAASKLEGGRRSQQQCPNHKARCTCSDLGAELAAKIV
ncbi:hypothetical protein K469DRAFT_699036 [Zopfia rhizophila CBS 207.26]|uniref:Uncharacterized protein n=1 Tax=Zopfia rhizophila CBS 207.26 TaxID=1314779 RepID=A0A6A6EXC0_9PEZI|nr:hypothetical protein K469DRAFT_699036 [Zopfia rhizophila CBS 207.26]